MNVINSYFNQVGWSSRFRAITGGIMITATAVLAIAAQI